MEYCRETHAKVLDSLRHVSSDRGAAHTFLITILVLVQVNKELKGTNKAEKA